MVIFRESCVCIWKEEEEEKLEVLLELPYLCLLCHTDIVVQAKLLGNLLE